MRILKKKREKNFNAFIFVFLTIIELNRNKRHKVLLIFRLESINHFSRGIRIIKFRETRLSSQYCQLLLPFLITLFIELKTKILYFTYKQT